jgi:diguanylate cyclase (GGDEF)-like protein
LDQFKLVNDSCGHLAGDMLLQQLAGQLKTKVRSSDALARLGGDEFALLLVRCDLAKAQQIVTDILSTVSEYRFSFDDKVFKVGASIGLAEIAPTHSATLGEVLAAADAACYTAKEQGATAYRYTVPTMSKSTNTTIS